jgi:glycosyltransferase involved in cell wall biosynthesis
MRNELRVLRVVHYPVYSGPHNEQLRLNNTFKERGIYTTMLLPDEPGNAADRLRSGGVDVVTMPLHRVRATRSPWVHTTFLWRFVPEVLAIRKLIRDCSIDVVVVGGLANPHAAFAAWLGRVPVVWQLLDTNAPRPLRWVMMPLVRRFAAAVLVDGEALIDFHFGAIRASMPVVVYYPPVDTRTFRPSKDRRRAARRGFGIPLDAPVIGMVANLNPMKGIEYFIRSAGLIHRERPDAWFLLVGARYATHEEYFQRLLGEIEQSGIPRDRIILAGGRSDVEQLYPAMDVKLITSVPNSEGTTTTAMEAMACGVPVVAVDVGAVSEIVQDTVTGRVVPALDPKAIAAATLSLVEDDTLRAKMGLAARKSAVERFDVEVCAATQIRALRAALDSARAT